MQRPRLRLADVKSTRSRDRCDRSDRERDKDHHER